MASLPYVARQIRVGSACLITHGLVKHSVRNVFAVVRSHLRADSRSDGLSTHGDQSERHASWLPTSGLQDLVSDSMLIPRASSKENKQIKLRGRVAYS